MEGECISRLKLRRLNISISKEFISSTKEKEDNELTKLVKLKQVEWDF